MDNGPVQGADDIDWAGLAPDRGAEIPELLRALADPERAVDAVRELHEILVFPGAGNTAAPTAVGFLVDIAREADPDQAWPVLNLLHELAVSAAADHLPQRRDVALWRDEVAWAAANDDDTVRAQYQSWLKEAPDEQQYRRMRHRAVAVAPEGGPALLQSELATYDAIRARIDDLLPLLRGADNRRGLDSAAEWTAYLLAWFPEEATKIIDAITAAVAEVNPGGWPDPLGAEVFALGMLADRDDITTTIYLGQQLLSRGPDKALAAAVGLGLIHGEGAPRQCVDVIEERAASLDETFGVAWPSSSGVEPAELGRLALGALGERSRQVRISTLPDGFEATAGVGEAPLVGDALDLVFGPRSEPHKPAEADAFDGYDSDQQEVLWAISGLPEEQWESADIPADLEVWGLPSVYEAFLEFTGAVDDSEAE